MDNSTNPITQMINAYKDAVRAKNIEAFCAIYDADVHIFDMWNHWVTQGIDKWGSMARGWFTSLGTEYVTVEARDVESSVADEMAFGHAIFTYTAFSANGEKLRSLDNRITVVLKRNGDRWKVIHEHSSAPIDHGSLKAHLFCDGQ